MMAGEAYNSADEELLRMAADARVKLAAYNALPELDFAARGTALADFVGSMSGFALISSPVFIEYGVNLHLSELVYFNVGASILDNAPIRIGDRTAFGPNVQLITATHPTHPADRIIPDPDGDVIPYRVVNYAHPITIGSDCWIGAGAIILPGVTIGDGTTVGAGSVVTKDLPDYVVAAGNPARVLRDQERGR